MTTAEQEAATKLLARILARAIVNQAIRQAKAGLDQGCPREGHTASPDTPLTSHQHS